MDNQRLKERNNELETYVSYLQDNIFKLEKQVRDLQLSLERAATKPIRVTNKHTTNHNTLIKNFTPITHQLIASQAPNLTVEDVYLPNAEGFICFLTDVCKDKLICSDYTRGILKWKDESNIIKDPKGSKLLFCEAISSRNEELLREVLVRLRHNNEGEEP